MRILSTLLLLLCLSPALAQEELPPYPNVLIETNLGPIKIELFSSRAPLHVKNFLDYVDSGFYTNTIFHRVVGAFVIQGGGYSTEYKLKDTTGSVPNESGNGLSNRRGYIGMARTGEPHSADSQFFINLADNVALDPRPTRWGYTVFGRVIEGMEIVDEIGYVATGPGPIPELSKDVPKEPIIVLNMTQLDAANAPADIDADDEPEDLD